MNSLARDSERKRYDQGKTGDPCADCGHCDRWPSDHKKASCSLYGEQGFHPERPVPKKCWKG